MDCESLPFTVSLDPFVLHGRLSLPPQAAGLVILMDGSGTMNDSREHTLVAECLNERMLGTLGLNLLTAEESASKTAQRHHDYDIDLLAGRLVVATDEVSQHPCARDLPIGYFATGSGAAAAFVAAVERPNVVHAVVEYGGFLTDDDGHHSGHLDLTSTTMKNITAATRFIIPEADGHARAIHEHALVNIGVPAADMAFLPTFGAGREAADQRARAAAALACAWFVRHLWNAPTLSEKLRTTGQDVTPLI